MYSSSKKIQKDKDVEPTEFEQSVAQALFDLENTHQELKSDQIDVSGNRKAVVVHVPYRLRKSFRKIHTKLVRELEKKFSGKDVVFIATRRIVRPPKKGSAVQRPRSRTLTSVHEAMLEDVVHPAEIVGKRVRYRLDGSKIMKVYLDPKARNDTEYKLETFSGVYRKLSGKDVVFKMYSSSKKIQKDKDVEPTEFEQSVAQALFDLENTHQELKSELKDLYINSASQIDVSGNRKAVVVHVPYRLRKSFRKIHTKLVRELEKKFSGKDVVFIATRRIVRPPKKGSAVQRPRSRTLTSVHEAMLEDVVHPAEIVGKGVRYRLDGSKIMKVYLDPKARNDTEYKLETFSGVYRKLSGKDVVFEYHINEA
ncbi:putative ribosomal protein S7e [Helianthus anomalus]